MEIKDIEVYANKIDLGCCEHKLRQYKYFFGYVGFKCCKVVCCLDCEKTQFVGSLWAKPIYLLSRRLFRNRLEVLKMIYIDMVGEDGKELVEAVSDKAYWGKRILIFRDGHEYYWVHNTYISKEASPTAMVYDVFLTEEDTADTIRQKMQESHASYFYVEDKDNVAYDLFSKLVPSGEFEPGRVYKIEGAGN